MQNIFTLVVAILATVCWNPTRAAHRLQIDDHQFSTGNGQHREPALCLIVSAHFRSLYLACRPTACTPGSAPGPTLGNDNDNDNEREFIQRVVINKSRTRQTLWCRRSCANKTVFKWHRKQASLIVGSLNATNNEYGKTLPFTRVPYI